MIYKLLMSGKQEYVQAKNEKHLRECYEEDFGDSEDILEIIPISDEEAKTIIIKNTEYDDTDPDDEPQFTLWACSVGDEFELLASTEYI